jgi:hypothetical protein
VTTSINPILRQRFAWLLWLAMLLPLAQGLAGWHAQTHWNSDRSGRSEEQHGTPDKLCDLCVIAAAVTGGAALDNAPALSPCSTPHAAPTAHADSMWCAPHLAAYQSRAPPAASV